MTTMQNFTKDVSFKWQHYRISSTDSKVREEKTMISWAKGIKKFSRILNWSRCPPPPPRGSPEEMK